MNPTPLLLSERFRGCLLGLACGDAVGTTVEFSPPGSFTPLTDMVGGGPFELEAGQWTDDTSMALCLADSLIACRGFDAHDQMRRYLAWNNEGYLSANGQCFDIGMTVATALNHYRRTGEPFAGSADPRSTGNGGLMRLAPAVLAAFPDTAKVQRYAADATRTTHASAEALDCSGLLAAVLCQTLHGADKASCLTGHGYAAQTPAVAAIAAGDYRSKPANAITGSGYAPASLEAALWCFAQATDLRTAILLAANLGDDADTTAAITGQIAGAFYGVAAIPAEWLAKLALCAQIDHFASALLDLSQQG